MNESQRKYKGVKMIKRNILVISDKKDINNLMINSLNTPETSIFCVQTSAKALEKIMQNIYNLIILDIFIRDMEGSILLQIIRRLTNTPILVLVQKTKTEDRIKLLSIGADDSLMLPTNIDELIVRVESCLKKCVVYESLRSVNIGEIGLVITPDRRKVEINAKEISITKREFDILYLLASNPGVVFSKEEIYSIIWSDKFIKDDSNIMSHIGRLRKKLGIVGNYIQTVWGVGYRFAYEEKGNIA